MNGNNHTTNERPIGAPRDTGLGPDYIDFDMRLSWAHKLGEKVNLRFTAEGFDIANRTNFASVNNEVSPLFGFEPGFTTFNVKGMKPGTPLPGRNGDIQHPARLHLRLSQAPDPARPTLHVLSRPRLRRANVAAEIDRAHIGLAVTQPSKVRVNSEQHLRSSFCWLF